jgi:hypothetical protein
LPTPPRRDLIDLARRLKPASAGPVRTLTASATPAVGSTTTFYVADETAKNYFPMTARLALRTNHVFWYVQQGVNLPDPDLQGAASFFESRTFPTEQRLFGRGWPRDDSHLTMLIGNVPDVGGYFSSADEYPRSVNPYSNDREMIYINVQAVMPGTPAFNGTVAHEFEHMIQFHVHPAQDSWINEGSAELAAQAVTGAASGQIPAFEQEPQTQLDAWASDVSGSRPHYGAAYLFMRYVAEQFGGFSSIGSVIAEPGRGTGTFAEFFAGLDPPREFDDVFANWVAANELDDPALSGGIYGYQNLHLTLKSIAGPTPGATVRTPVTQFGARYFVVHPDRPAVLSFAGDPTGRLIGADPHDSAYEWWANKGDSIDTRLTRSVDLSAVRRASLTFWAWYDIEDGYDYAYVEASTDGGTTWDTLKATTTTTDNPNGQNYGNGFTGKSGGTTATWVPETVDLSRYGGRTILLRFEYVTDDSYNADGFALDDVEIPAIGLVDHVDANAGWTAEGFARIDNRIPESYLVEAIRSNGPDRVARMGVGPHGRGQLKIDGGTTTVVAVAGLAPITTQDTSGTLTLSNP